MESSRGDGAGKPAGSQTVYCLAEEFGLYSVFGKKPGKLSSTRVKCSR